MIYIYYIKQIGFIDIHVYYMKIKREKIIKIKNFLEMHMRIPKYVHQSEYSG